MIVTCKECNSNFRLDDKLVSPTGSTVRCSICKNVFVIYSSKPESTESSFELPGPFTTEDFLSSSHDDSQSLDMDTDQIGSFDDLDIGDIKIDYDDEISLEEGEDENLSEDVDLSDLGLAEEFNIESNENDITLGDEFSSDLDKSDIQIDFEDEIESLEQEKNIGEDAFSISDIDVSDTDIDEFDENIGDDELDDIDSLKIEDMLDSSDAEMNTSDQGDEELDLELSLEPSIDNLGDYIDDNLESEFETSLEGLTEDENEDLEDEDLLGLDDSKNIDMSDLDGMDSSDLDDSSSENDFDLEQDISFDIDEKTDMVDDLDAEKFDLDDVRDDVISIDDEKNVTKKPKRKRSKVFYLLLIFILAITGIFVKDIKQIINLKTMTNGIVDIQSIKMPDFIENILRLKDKDPFGKAKLIIPEESLEDVFVKNEQAGKLFVIRGEIQNKYNNTRTNINVMGKLFTTGKEYYTSKTIYAGNILTETELANLDMVEIDSLLQNRSGDLDINLMGIKTEEKIQFMIVFADIPENLEKFTIEVVSSTPVK